MDEHEIARWHAMLERHENQMASIRIRGYRNAFAGMIGGVTFGLALAWAPTWLSLPAIGFLLAYCLFLLWSIYPGRCAICGRAGAVPVPKDDPFERREWWNLRSQLRSNQVWVCQQHLMPFIAAKARERTEP